MAPVVRNQFGPASLGFLVWLSSDGAFAAGFQFDTDTDGNGKIEAKVGDHGEQEGDKPSAVWFDTRSGASEKVDEFVALDSRRLRVVTRTGDILTLRNGRSGKTTVLGRTSITPDLANRCMPPRDASFDATGRYVVWMSSEKTYEVFDTLTRKTTRLIRRDDLWRVEVNATGASIEVTVPNGSPVASQGTCACWWCPTFARSIGKYGQSGGPPTYKVLSGTRLLTSTTMADVKGFGVLNSKQSWQRFDGTTGTIEDDCEIVEINAAPAPLIKCKTGYFVELKEGLKRLPQIQVAEDPEAFGPWVAVRNYAGRGVHLSRLNLLTGEIQQGPAVSKWSARPMFSGIWSGYYDGSFILFDVANGDQQSVATVISPESLDGLSFGSGGNRYGVDPVRSIVEERPLGVWPTSRGCVANSEQFSRITKGPWALRCPQKSVNKKLEKETP